MRRVRRDHTGFNLSFLDCICCGFGAILLLFVLSKRAEPIVIEQVTVDLSTLLERLEEELNEIRGEVDTFNRDLEGKVEQLSEENQKIARLQEDLSKIEGQYKASHENAAVQNKIKFQMAEALQIRSDDMKRLLKDRPRRPVKRSIGGIPVDSEYIIFIIDTSGSMKGYAWPLLLAKIRETLKIYPKVRGIQVMNDMGAYLFPQYAGRWIPDTPARRKAIINTLRTWQSFSNSSPVEGITEAIRTYYSPDKKISLYVLGDEFTGPSAQAVVNEVDLINKADASGQRRVRIHSVGFPVVIQAHKGTKNTGQRFAMLMRALCERNGGTFVGLNTTRP